MTTMEPEDITRSDVDTEMTVLSSGNISDQSVDAIDEVENLRNSLRKAVHDDNVRPKMQCLMMDSSFSMVTMQGEDSGIEWETTPSHCSTPWPSEAGISTMDNSSSAASPVSPPAGRIIFVMDEELITRQKKTKERTSSQKSKRDRQQEVVLGSCDNISGRPELTSFSEPNVKTEEEENEEEATDPSADKEQRLFSLVSEGSEILNIVVPPKLVTVDEEVSREMVDNLAYLEETAVTKASEETHDEVFDLYNEPEISSSGTAASQLHPSGPHAMDPPGAPVARPPPLRGASGNVDYFEAYSLIDAQAPGSPAVKAGGQVEPEADEATSQDTERPEQSKSKCTMPTTKVSVGSENVDTISVEEFTSELLDDVFYGGTDDMNTTLGRGVDVTQSAPSRVPSKPSGSTLFGNQEDILTPIFLPEGPPKIIDPILLEEPKAMAFLYTDLYEEATGSRKKEEDTESISSEKSFHSRHSDREARGYLEKYMLIDETPVLEVEPSEKEKCTKEGPRLLSKDVCDVFVSKPEKMQMPSSEEEITDFFRSSANSSPCEEPFPRSLEEEEPQTTTKTKVKANKNVSIKIENISENPVYFVSELSSEEPDWGSIIDDKVLDDGDNTAHPDQNLWKQDMEMEETVIPPRKKALSSPKACLDLTPLTPVDITEEKEEVAGKEQRVEEKETASPAETADEGDGEEAKRDFSDVPPRQDELAAQGTETPQTESVEHKNEITAGKITPTVAEDKDITVETSDSATEQTAAEEAEVVSSESEKTETQEESSTVVPSEQPKVKGQCIIL